MNFNLQAVQSRHLNFMTSARLGLTYYGFWPNITREGTEEIHSPFYAVFINLYSNRHC